MECYQLLSTAWNLKNLTAYSRSTIFDGVGSSSFLASHAFDKIFLRVLKAKTYPVMSGGDSYEPGG